MDITKLVAPTLFDFFLLVLAVVSVRNAFRQGLVKAAFSVSGLITGVLAAQWLHTCVAARLQGSLQFSLFTQILAYMAVVGIVYAAFWVSSGLARHVATGAGMNFSDRFLGAGLGLVRAGLFGAMVLVSLTAALPNASFLQNSHLAPYLMSGTRATSFIVPEDFQVKADPYAPPLISVEGDSLVARALGGQ